jgi:hypothetical protein
MATTTPNYGWVVPTSTDLVKDGATAIETLGDSADATVKALNPETTLGDISYRSSTANTNTRLAIGTTGQVLTVAGGVPSWAAASSGFVLLNTTSFSASASTSINDVFSTTYDNYKIVIYTSADSDRDILLRLRVGGTDNSTASSYVWHRHASFAGTALFSDTSDSYWNIGCSATAAKFPQIVELGNPFIAEATGITATGGRHTLTQVTTGYHNQNTSYTGFTIFPNTGNITGKVSVYGYAK